MRQWIVILEATSRSSNIEIEAVRRLVEAVAMLQPGALYSPDRYALQIRVRAANPSQALAYTLRRWHDEVCRIGDVLSACTLARAEVMTPEEYALESSARQDDPTFTPIVSDKLAREGDELLCRALLEPVTGLAGRELFVHELELALAAGRGNGTQLSVLTVALEDMPTVQAELGLHSLDELRQRLAACMKECVRPTDTPARLDDDLFALLLTNASADLVATVAARIVERLEEPFSLNSARVTVSARVGVALSAPGDDADSLVRRAEIAARGAHEHDDAAEGFGPALAVDEIMDVPPDGYLRYDAASTLAVLTAVARSANIAASLDEAAVVAIQQVCVNIGWAAGRLCCWVGDELAPTDVRWPSTTPWTERWGGVAAAEPASGTDDIDQITSTAVAVRGIANDPCGRARVFSSLRVPIVVGTEVVAALEFVADHAVVVDEPMEDSLATVGIQLGRVVERNRMRAALRHLADAQADCPTS